MGFSRPEYCSGLPCPPPWDLPDPGIKPRSHASPELQVYSLPSELPGKPHTILIRLGLFLPTSSETGLSFFSFSVFHSSIFFIIVVSHLRLFILFFALFFFFLVKIHPLWMPFWRYLHFCGRRLNDTIITLLLWCLITTPLDRSDLPLGHAGDDGSCHVPWAWTPLNLHDQGAGPLPLFELPERLCYYTAEVVGEPPDDLFHFLVLHFH